MCELPELSYDHAALEPIVDARTMERHHDIHHARYVAGANRALDALNEARSESDFRMIAAWERDIAFHASRHVRHSRFWESVRPNHTAPDPALSALIERDFGSLSSLRYRHQNRRRDWTAAFWEVASWHAASLRPAHQRDKRQDASL
jgi:Fe-Mn family superoxide dismutase